MLHKLLWLQIVILINLGHLQSSGPYIPLLTIIISLTIISVTGCYGVSCSVSSVVKILGYKLIFFKLLLLHLRCFPNILYLVCLLGFVRGFLIWLVGWFYGMSPWHNGYCWMKWNQWSKFKSWIRLFLFHFVLMLQRKVWIHLSS